MAENLVGLKPAHIFRMLCIGVALGLLLWNYGYSTLLCHCIVRSSDLALRLISMPLGNIDCPVIPSFAAGALLRLEITNCTPLELACREGDVALVEACLGRGANPNNAPVGCELPLEAAVLRDNPATYEVLEALISHGAEVDGRSSAAPTTVLFRLANRLSYASAAQRQVVENSICLLLESGAGAYDDDGWSILHPVVRADDAELLSRLTQDYHLEASVSPDGRTLYQYALDSDASGCIGVLRPAPIPVIMGAGGGMSRLL